MLAQHAASYNKGTLCFRCNSSSSSKCSAIIFLLAETTALPLFKAVVTISYAASASSINSTMTLISGSLKISFLSKVKFSAPISRVLFLSFTQIFLMFAFSPGVFCKTSYSPKPTHPKPNNPIFNFFLDILCVIYMMIKSRMVLVFMEFDGNIFFDCILDSLFQVGNQIIGIFQANRKSDQTVGHARLVSFFCRN
ncbi:hypothetical protein D9M72_445230 [compost metagenome]